MSAVLNVAGHPIDLSDGRVLAPGEDADEVDTDTPHNRALVVNGHLLVTEGMTPRKAQPERLVEQAKANHDPEGDDR